MSVQLAAGRDPLLCSPRSMMRMVCIAAPSRIGWPVEERIALGVSNVRMVVAGCVRECVSVGQSSCAAVCSPARLLAWASNVDLHLVCRCEQFKASGPSGRSAQGGEVPSSSDPKPPSFSFGYALCVGRCLGVNVRACLHPRRHGAYRKGAPALPSACAPALLVNQASFVLHLQSEREREDVRACVEGICARLSSSYKTQPHPSLHASRDIDAAGTLAMVQAPLAHGQGRWSRREVRCEG